MLRKKMARLFMAFVIVFSLIPATHVTAAAEFEIVNGALVKYNGKGGAVTIPDGVKTIGRGSVSGVEGGVFAGNTELTSITIPNSVTKIESNVFEGCTGLTSITIPSSVTSLGRYLFGGCTSLTSVTFLNSNTNIEDYMFKGCTELTSITIPSNATFIGWSAFSGCTGLTSITIPNSVTTIGQSAFSGCTGLTSVTIPNSVTKLGWGAFSDCTGLTSVTISNSITIIESRTFMNTGLTSVTIPNGVTEISGFSGCKDLTTIVIPDSVTFIDPLSFFDSKNLTIYGVAGSYAETFANDYYYTNIEFSTATPPASVPTQPTTPVPVQQPVQPTTSQPAQPTEQPTTQSDLTAVPTASRVLVNENPVNFDAYNIDGSNYFKLRDLSYALSGTEKQFGVSWDNAANAINLLANEAYNVTGGEMAKGDGTTKNAELTTSTILLDGKEIKLTAYNIGGNNYFKLRDIGKAFNFAINWDGANNAIMIDTSSIYTEF